MDCPDDATLATLAQGIAPASVRAEFELHLDGCSACRAAFTALAGVVSRARSDDALSTTFPAANARSPTSLAPGAAVGRYVVVRQLGAGAMGVVYLAYDPHLDRRVALKLVSPAIAVPGDSSARLILEARAMAKLSHPCVVPVHDAGFFSDNVFIAMEFVEGQTLTRWMSERRPGTAKVLDAFRSAAEGLAAAHRAGIVHRDFKPDNVLVGNDGRVRVTDFGLARAAAEALDEGTPATELGAEVKTRTGALVGTPAYMAPEQLVGGRASPASDQFSFCVSLFEGLGGARPFQARSVGELLAAIRAGANVDGLALPRSIRLALARGLSARPEDRFPSMEELLLALSEQPRTIPRSALAAIASLGVLAVAGVAVKNRVDARAALCSGSAEHLANVWSPARSDDVRRAFDSTKLPYAQDGWRTAAAGLDAYAAKWVEAHREACEATRLRGEQTEALMTLRMVCLERRRKDLSALVDVLASANPAVVQRASQAVRGLPLLSECADTDQLSTVSPRPSDLQARAALETLDGSLARTRALLEAGRYPDALPAAKQADADAEPLAYRPSQAEARYLLGIALHRTGDRKAAVPALEEASWLAESGRADVVAARARTELVYLVGYEGGDFEGALAWARRARATIDRLGHSDDLEGGLEGMLGVLYLGHRDFERAVEHGQQALPLLERALGKEHRRVANVLDNMGGALQNLGRRDEALAHYQKALEVRERLLGPHHPDVGASHNNLGTLSKDLGRLDDALAEQQKALSIWNAAYGANHPVTALSHANLGLTFEALGQLEEADKESRLALASFEADRGPQGALVGRVLIDLARISTARGLGRESVALAERALSIVENLKPPEPDVLASALIERGNARLSAGQPAAALGDLERAATLEKNLENDRGILGHLHLTLARALVAAKKSPARALELGERAKTELDAAGRRADAAEAARWLEAQKAR